MTKLTEAQRKEIRDKVQNELLNQPVQMGQEFINDFFGKKTIIILKHSKSLPKPKHTATGYVTAKGNLIKFG